MPAALRRGSRSRRERLEAEGARGRERGGPEASTSGSGGREPGPRRGSGAGRRLRLPLALAAAAVHVVNVHAANVASASPSAAPAAPAAGASPPFPPLVEVLDLGGAGAASPWTVRAPANASVPEVPATVPGQVHLDLQRAGVVPELYEKFQDWEGAWVTAQDWLWRRDVPAPACDRCGALLEFDGLDTLANVTLNGEVVLRSDNQHVRHAVRVDDVVRFGATNALEVAIASPVAATDQRRDEYPVPLARKPNAYLGRDTHPQFLRKDQSNFGWDWGPAAATSGIWRPARLVAFRVARLQAPVVHVVGGEGGRPFVVKVRAEVQRVAGSGPLTVKVAVAGVVAEAAVVCEADAPAGAADLELRVAGPALWWPHGLGPPTLHELVVELWGPAPGGAGPDSGGLVGLGRVERRVGFRTFEVREEAPGGGAAGRRMAFAVNGKEIFSKGANVVPLDALDGRVTEATIDTVLQSAQDAHFNTVRVWGGGHYLRDYFYDKADELGLLVWQEFMFACSEYPVDSAFLRSVRAEVKDVVRRLAHHPSVVLFSGNNENQHWATREAPDDGKLSWENIGNITHYDTLYQGTVRAQLAAEFPEAAYWPSSPSNGMLTDDVERQLHIPRWGYEYDPSIGDVHYYDYESNCVDPDTFPRARFVSEYGWQSYGTWKTAAADLGAEAFEVPAGDLVRHRQHHPNGTEQQLALGAMLIGRFAAGKSRSAEERYDDFAFASQVTQALCHAAAAAHFRRWRSASPFTAGALYWQLNDAWQGPSWASVEYDGHWKLNHYAFRRVFAPVSLTLFRPSSSTKVGASVAVDEVPEELAGPAGADGFRAQIVLMVYEWTGRFVRSCLLPARRWRAQSSAAQYVEEADLLVGSDPREVFVRAVLMPEGGESEISRVHYFPQELRGGFANTTGLTADGVEFTIAAYPGEAGVVVEVRAASQNPCAAAFAVLEAGGWPGGPSRIPGRFTVNFWETILPGEAVRTTFRPWGKETVDPDELQRALRLRHLRQAVPPPER